VDFADGSIDVQFEIDADTLEHGVTQQLPVVPRPRWTPELVTVPGVAGHVASGLATRHARRVIGPRAPRDQVAGELVVLDKTR
jgi:hypothetical protein